MQIHTRTELGKLIDHFKLPRIALEIGVAEGKFTEQMLKWNLEKLYLIDIWQQITEQKGDASHPQSWHDNNLKEVKERTEGHNVVILKGMSAFLTDHIPNNSLGLVYVDADHSYQGALADLERFLPKLVKGGIMAGHDYLSPDYGVERAVNDFAKGRFEINTIPEEDVYNAGFWFIKK